MQTVFIIRTLKANKNSTNILRVQ